MHIPRRVHNALVGLGRNSCETAVIQKPTFGQGIFRIARHSGEPVAFP